MILRYRTWRRSSACAPHEHLGWIAVEEARDAPLFDARPGFRNYPVDILDDRHCPLSMVARQDGSETLFVSITASARFPRRKRKHSGTG
ncbi:hypothetical protein DMC64_20415 [Amycolatopsis sp. WAC 04197]|nr:hypothetical protein DMC64_20415 [Amycolatopsis sp. WAC 04197]